MHTPPDTPPDTPPPAPPQDIPPDEHVPIEDPPLAPGSPSLPEPVDVPVRLY